MSLELVSGLIGFAVTLAILSYLVGDNPAFRIAVHLFVGVVAGYVAVVAWWQVLLPHLILPLVSGSGPAPALLAVPLLLSGMLLMKSWPPLSKLGSPAMGVLVGIAAAVAIGGAVQGTLFPQVGAVAESFDAGETPPLDRLINSVLVLFGAVTSLAYFHFSSRRRADGSTGRLGIVELMSAIGAIFLAITFGVLFAGVYSAALTALIERLHFMGTIFGPR